MLLSLHANCPKWRQVIDAKIRQLLDDPSVEAKLQKCLDHVSASGRRFDFGHSVDELVSHIWPPLALMSGIDSGLKIGSRVSVSSRVGTIIGSTTSTKSQSVKVAWEDDNSVTSVMTVTLVNITPKTSFKLSRKFLQPKLVSILFRVATEMSVLPAKVDWMNMLKNELSESSRASSQASDFIDSLFTSRDRRSSRYEKIGFSSDDTLFLGGGRILC